MTVPWQSRQPGDNRPTETSPSAATDGDPAVQPPIAAETAGAIGPEDIAAAAGRVVEGLVHTPTEPESGSELARVERQWGDMIAAASLAIERPSAPVQRAGGSGRRAPKKGRSARKPVTQDDSGSEEFLDSELRRFIDAYEPIIGADGTHYIGEANAAELASNRALREKIIKVTDGILEGLGKRPSTGDLDELERLQRTRDRCGAIKDSIRACISPEERQATEQQELEETIRSTLTEYHRLQREINGARARREDTATLILRQRRLAVAISRTLIGMQPDAQAVFEGFMERTVRNLDKRDSAHEGITGSYETMMKGIKLELGALDALRALFATDAYAGWSVEVASIEDDVRLGRDFIVTVPLGDGTSERINVDIKAMGPFNTGIVHGEFTRVQGRELSVAERRKDSERTVVINAEHKPVGGGLAPVRPGDKRSPDSLRLNRPRDFARWFTVVATESATKQRELRDEGGRS